MENSQKIFTCTPGEFTESTDSLCQKATLSAGYGNASPQGHSKGMLDFQDYLKGSFPGDGNFSPLALPPSSRVEGGSSVFKAPVGPSTAQPLSGSWFGDRSTAQGPSQPPGPFLSEGGQSTWPQVDGSDEVSARRAGFDFRSPSSVHVARRFSPNHSPLRFAEQQGSKGGPTSLGLPRAPSLSAWETTAGNRVAIKPCFPTHLQPSRFSQDLQGAAKRQKMIADGNELFGEVPVLAVSGGPSLLNRDSGRSAQLGASEKVDHRNQEVVSAEVEQVIGKAYDTFSGGNGEARFSLPQGEMVEDAEIASVSGKGKVSCEEGAGSTGLDKACNESGGFDQPLKLHEEASEGNQQDSLGNCDEEKRKCRERRREERRRDSKKRGEKHLSGASCEKGQTLGPGRGNGKDGGQDQDQWSGSRNKKSRKHRSDCTSKGFAVIRHFTDAVSFRKEDANGLLREQVPSRTSLPLTAGDAAKVGASEKESLPGFGSFRGWVKAVQRGKAPRLGATGAGGELGLKRNSILVGGESGVQHGDKEKSLGARYCQSVAGDAAKETVVPDTRTHEENPSLGRTEISSGLVATRVGDHLFSSLHGETERDATAERITRDGVDNVAAADVVPREGGLGADVVAEGDMPLPAANGLEGERDIIRVVDASALATTVPPRRTARLHHGDVEVPAVRSRSGGTDEQVLRGADSDEPYRTGGAFQNQGSHEIQVVPSASPLWSEQVEQVVETEGQLTGPRETSVDGEELQELTRGRGWQQRLVPVSRQGNGVHNVDRQAGSWAMSAANTAQAINRSQQGDGLPSISPNTGEGLSGTTGTGTTVTAIGKVSSTPLPGITSTMPSSGVTAEDRLRDRWIGRFMGPSGKASLRTGSGELLEGSSQQNNSLLGQGPMAGSDKPSDGNSGGARGAPLYNSYLRYQTDVQKMTEKPNSGVGVRMPQPFAEGPFVRGSLGRSGLSGVMRQLQGTMGNGAHPFGPLAGMMVGQKEADNGSGEECLHGLGVVEYAASQASLRAWRLESACSRAALLKEYGAGTDSLGQLSLTSSAHLALNTRAPSAVRSFEEGRACPFCNLPGHPLVLCSETRDCELPMLVKRAAAMEVIVTSKMSLSSSPSPTTGPSSHLSSQVVPAFFPGLQQQIETRPTSETRGTVLENQSDIPAGNSSSRQPVCLRCLEIGHWGADCMLTCSEAAAKVRERESSLGQKREENFISHEMLSLGSNNLCVTSDHGGRSSASGALPIVCEKCSFHGFEGENCRHSAEKGGRFAEGGGCEEEVAARNLSSAEADLEGREDSDKKSSKKWGENDWKVEERTASRNGGGRSSAWERRRLKEVDFLGRDERNDPGLTPNGTTAREENWQSREKQEQEIMDGEGLDAGMEVEKNSRRPNNLIATSEKPAGLLEGIESIRLLRKDLLKWAESPSFAGKVKGYFVRLRFGKRQEDPGGTGYRMARITGAPKKRSVGQAMTLVVDFGDGEYTVDGQYVSNKPFTEVELLEWQMGAGRPTIVFDEIEAKLRDRQNWPSQL